MVICPLPARSLVLALLLAGLVVGVLTPIPVSAHTGVTVVHWETVAVGPYPVRLGFSEWPMRAERSLDILIEPADGLTGKQGSVTLIAPSGARNHRALVRHPRQRASWGLDVIALPEAGPWTIQLTIDGPAGRGVGQLDSLTLLDQPGPSKVLSWSIGLLPLIGLLGLGLLARQRARSAQPGPTWSWSWADEATPQRSEAAP